jgi:hypothetical protein
MRKPPTTSRDVVGGRYAEDRGIRGRDPPVGVDDVLGGQATFSGEDDLPDDEPDDEESPDDDEDDESAEDEDDAPESPPEEPLDDPFDDPWDEEPTVEDDLPEPRLSVR